MELAAAGKTGRRQNAPAVEAMLRKLDDALLACAPTSHLFHGDDARLKALPIAASLDKGTLRSFQRESTASILAAAAASSVPVSNEALATKLSFAVAEDDIGPAAAAHAARNAAAKGALYSPARLGKSTLNTADVATLTSTAGLGAAGLPADAEVRKLSGRYLGGTADARTAKLYKSFADTSTLGQGRAPLNDTVEILLRVGGAEPVLEATYAKEFAYTDEMRHVCRNRDITHILKTDEEKKYAEEAIKSDRGVDKSTKRGAKARPGSPKGGKK